MRAGLRQRFGWRTSLDAGIAVPGSRVAMAQGAAWFSAVAAAAGRRRGRAPVAVARPTSSGLAGTTLACGILAAIALVGGGRLPAWYFTVGGAAGHPGRGGGDPLLGRGLVRRRPAVPLPRDLRRLVPAPRRGAGGAGADRRPAGRRADRPGPGRNRGGRVGGHRRHAGRRRPAGGAAAPAHHPRRGGPDRGRPPRPPDRPAEPARLRGGVRRRARARPPDRAEPERDRRGPGPLQAHQRRARPRRGRRRAAPGGAGAERRQALAGTPPRGWGARSSPS